MGEPKHRQTIVNAFHDLQRESPQSRSLGDVVQLYDVCGRMGLCPECRRKRTAEALAMVADKSASADVVNAT